MNIDRHSIADRIRELIGPLQRDTLEETAARLRVSELALRMSIDPDSPQPTIDTIVGVIREYGVDPMWLLSGEYLTETHRLAEEDSHASVRDALERIGRKSDTPVESMMAVLHETRFN